MLFRKILVAVFCLACVPAFAGNGLVWNGRCWVYQPVYKSYAAAAVVAPAKTTTVVNNLIGIPVPVQYSQPIAAQGNTVYGYSSVADTYGSVDMGLLYNQAARLTNQAQQLAGQAATDFSALVESEGQNRADVAKIVAQGQAAREALIAAKGESSSYTQRSNFSFKVTQDQNGEMRVEKISGSRASNTGDFSLATTKISNISDLLQAKCTSCHNNERAEGSLNLLGVVNDAQQRKILDRITTNDPDRRMPRQSDGTAGRLDVDEIALFFGAMTQK